MRLFKLRSINLLILAGCFSALVTHPAFGAGAPIPFDGYTASNGAITADCPLVGGVQAICVDGVEDDGMLQRKITLPSGINQGTYIQFILTEPGVSGDASADAFSIERGNLLFTNEDFVKQNHRGPGIASKNTIIESVFSDPVTEQRFVNELEYKYGWAMNASNPWVVNNQSISTVDYSADALNPIETFNSTADILVSGVTFNSAASIVFKQAIDLSTDSNIGMQKFQYDLKKGPYNWTSRALGDGGPLFPDGGDLAWDAFENLAALWLGQVLDIGTAADQTFGHTRIENQNQLTKTSYTSLAEAETAAWPGPPFTGPFAPVETIASGLSVVAPTATVAAPLPLQPTVTTGTGSANATVVSTPLPLDNWTVANGVFTLSPCPGFAVCRPPIVNEGGMMQRIITAAGTDYVQTIVTNQNATGDPTTADFSPGSLAFKNETFVTYNSFVEGIAASLHLADQDIAYQTINPSTVNYALPTSAGEFIYNTVVKTGWAHGGPLDPIVAIDQSILVDETVSYLNTSSMYEAFSIKRGETQADTSMDMLTAVGHTTSGSSGFNFPIMTATSVRSGAFQNTAHDGDGIGIDDPYLLSSVNGNISWSEGDAIQATWLVGQYVTSSNSNNLTAVNSLSYTNLSTGERIESTETDGNLSIGETFDPTLESWDPVFGTAPPAYVDPFAPPS